MGYGNFPPKNRLKIDRDRKFDIKNS